MSVNNTAWKAFKYGVFSGPYFPVFGLNTEIYEVNGLNTGNSGPEKTPYDDENYDENNEQQQIS